MSEEVVVEETGTLELVYIGQRIVKGKRQYYWKILDSDSCFTWDKAITPASVGSVYTFVSTKGGASVKYTGKNLPSYSRHYEDKEQVYKWDIQDSLARQEAATKSMNTKAAKEGGAIDKELDKLAEMTKNFTSHERLAFMLRVAEVVMRR